MNRCIIVLISELPNYQFPTCSFLLEVKAHFSTQLLMFLTKCLIRGARTGGQLGYLILLPYWKGGKGARTVYSFHFTLSALKFSSFYMTVVKFLTV